MPAFLCVNKGGTEENFRSVKVSPERPGIRRRIPGTETLRVPLARSCTNNSLFIDVPKRAGELVVILRNIGESGNAKGLQIRLAY
jgi:hypothetical protein